jgi:hypothetical protein
LRAIRFSPRALRASEVSQSSGSLFSLILACQFFADVVGGLVQDFPEHHRVPVLRDGRADALEHVLEEMSDLAAPGGFGFGTNRLPGASDHPGHEEYGCSKP